MTITASRAFAIVALIVALASYVVEGPLLLVAIVILAIAVIVDN